jgi:hypothetical protein
MDMHFWHTKEFRDFWGPTLKYVGIAVTMVLGVIGTLRETHKEGMLDDESAKRERRLTTAGRIIVLGIVVSSIIATLGVVLEEAQKVEDAKAAQKASDDAKAKADEQIGVLRGLTSDTKTALSTLQNVVNTGNETVARLGVVTGQTKQTLANVGVVRAKVENVQYPTTTLIVEAQFSIADSDAAMRGLIGNRFLELDTANASDVSMTPWSQDQYRSGSAARQYFDQLFEHVSPHLIVYDGGEASDAYAAEADLVLIPSKCGVTNIGCAEILHDARRKRTVIRASGPARFQYKAHLTSLPEFARKLVVLSVRSNLLSGQAAPTGLRVDSVTLWDGGSNRQLYIAGPWPTIRRSNFSISYGVKLPNDVSPSSKKKIHWE